MNVWGWIRKIGEIVGIVTPAIVDAVQDAPPKLDAPLGESQTERARREADAAAPKPKPPA